MKKIKIEKYWIWLFKYYLGKWYRVSDYTEIPYFLCRPRIAFKRNFTGFYFLINILKITKESIFLKFSGRRPQIFDPKKDIFSVPWNTVLTKGVENWEKHRKLYGCSASGSDTPFIMENEIPLLILNISVTRTWRFMLCIKTEPSFSTCDLSIPNLVQQSKILYFDLPCSFPFQVCYLVKTILFLSFSFALPWPTIPISSTWFSSIMKAKKK